MRLGQRIIDLESAIHGRSRFWHRLARRDTDVLLEQEVGIRQANVTESEIRIEFDRLLELLDGLFESVWCALVPKITSAQIELISLRIGRVAFDKPALIFAG